MSNEGGKKHNNMELREFLKNEILIANLEKGEKDSSVMKPADTNGKAT